jgi:quercetin dioxygenase-like cupin family protein
LALDRSTQKGAAVQTWDTRTLAIEPHHPQVLRSDDEVRAIAIQLPAGEQLQEHQVHERAYLVVITGELTIERGGQVVTGGPGTLVHFEPNERRAVTAGEDSRLLLILAPWPGVGHPSER